jgi:ligand-binding sensor domain-containing protein
LKYKWLPALNIVLWVVSSVFVMAWLWNSVFNPSCPPRITSIEADTKGKVYAVGYAWGNRVQCFDSSGKFVRELVRDIGWRIATDSAGNVYVPDGLGISKFNASGKALKHVDINREAFNPGCEAVTVARNGDLYVVLTLGGVVRCDASGHRLRTIWKDTDKEGVRPFQGSELAMSSRGNLLIAGDYCKNDTDVSSCIKEFTPSGKYIRDVLSPQDAKHMGLRLRSIALNAKDEIYVASGEGLWKLSPDGKLVSHWQPLDKAGKIAYSECVEVDGKGYLYAGTDDRILKYDPSGKLVAEWLMKKSY